MNALQRLLQPAQQWLESLQPRERLIVIVGGITLVFILLYLLIWAPITEYHEEQQLRLQSQQQLYSWIKNAAQEVRQLNGSSAGSATRYQNQSISTLAERSARTTGVKAFISKIEQSQNDVKVTLSEADFDRIIHWLADLQDKYAISSTSVKIEKTKTAGAVNAHITLERTL